MDLGVAAESGEEEGEEENSNDHSGSQIKAAGRPYVLPRYKLKSRLRWNSELHASFVNAVSQLGGHHKATPKSIMQIMDVQGLTLFHVKSHLQKYRLGKYGMKEWREGPSSKTGFVMKENTVSEVLKGQDSGTSNPNSLSLLRPLENKICELTQALKRRKEAQESFRLRNEVQKHLQLRQESQSRYINRALENACEKLAHQFLARPADYAGVFEDNSASLETMGSKPHQKDLNQYSAYHMDQILQPSFDNQLASFQPPTDAHFATRGHLISDGSSGYSPVQVFSKFKTNVNIEEFG